MSQRAVTSSFVSPLFLADMLIRPVICSDSNTAVFTSLFCRGVEAAPLCAENSFFYVSSKTYVTWVGAGSELQI